MEKASSDVAVELDLSVTGDVFVARAFFLGTAVSLRPGNAVQDHRRARRVTGCVC